MESPKVGVPRWQWLLLHIVTPTPHSDSGTQTLSVLLLCFPFIYLFTFGGGYFFFFLDLAGMKILSLFNWKTRQKRTKGGEKLYFLLKSLVQWFALTFHWLEIGLQMRPISHWWIETASQPVSLLPYSLAHRIKCYPLKTNQITSLPGWKLSSGFPLHLQ